MSNTTNVSDGVGLFGLTFIVLLILKLTGLTSISWWWVTAPLWGPWAVMLSIILVILLIAGVIAILDRR